MTTGRMELSRLFWTVYGQILQRLWQLRWLIAAAAGAGMVFWLIDR